MLGSFRQQMVRMQLERLLQSSAGVTEKWREVCMLVYMSVLCVQPRVLRLQLMVWAIRRVYAASEGNACGGANSKWRATSGAVQVCAACVWQQE